MGTVSRSIPALESIIRWSMGHIRMAEEEEQIHENGTTNDQTHRVQFDAQVGILIVILQRVIKSQSLPQSDRHHPPATSASK